MKLGDMIGQRFGHYLVVESIGAGGMGQVFRAHDERLDRDVALKVLPAETLAGEAARRRFRREALALSRLNHPNIATVYDFDSVSGIDFLVMEYVSGLTLEQKLMAGPMTEKEIVRLGAQIARALEEAHENGVVHRDLKPANIMITPKGVVKVLDFGLAGILEQEESSITQSTGLIAVAGTLPYMAPEVLRGNLGDARSDIWAFGATLYEMASGKAPFKGRTQLELSEAIVRQEPPPLPPEISPPVRTVISNCLAKSPEQRYQNAGEIRASLEVLLSASSVSIVPLQKRPWWLWAGVAALAVIAVALAVLLIYRFRRPPPLDVGGQLVLLLSSEGLIEGPDLSPDGKMVVYAAEENGQFDLFLNRVAGGGRVRLTNDNFREGHPTFSPDGERIAFVRTRGLSDPPEICVMPSLGGEISPVVANATYPRWSPDGTRFVYVAIRPGAPMVLATALANGSDERVLLAADDIYPFMYDPAWSPDGQQIAITRSTGGMAGEIWLVPVAGGAPRRLSQDGPTIFSEAPVFTPDGRGIVHASNRAGATNLWVMPLDGAPPYRLTNGPGPDETPAIAHDGTIAFVNSQWRHLLFTFDLATGATREIAKHPGYVWAPAFSPDGREIAYSYFENRVRWHIWVAPLNGGAPRRLSSGTEDEIYPRFTHDGSTVVFSNWPGRGQVWRMPRGGGPPVPLTSHEGDSFADVSPDGRWVAFARAEGKSVRVYIAPFSGGQARRLTESPSTLPRWSPDGKFILFSPDRTLRAGVFVIRADGTGERRLSDSGGWATWFPDGKRIAFLTMTLDGVQQLRTVSVTGNDAQLVGNLHWNTSNNPIDISPDGKLVATGNAVHFQDDIWLLKPQK